MGKMNEIDLTLKYSLRKLIKILIQIIVIAILEISLLMNMKYSRTIENQKEYIEILKENQMNIKKEHH